ncbi:MAG: hypothetical protein QXR53_01175 [Candidatus Norongarragalinales archaeon]
MLEKHSVLLVAIGFLALSVAFFVWVAFLPPAPLVPVNNQIPQAGRVEAYVLPPSPTPWQEAPATPSPPEEEQA